MNAILAILAALSLGGGLLGWIWTGNWRVGATGLVIMFVIAVIGSQLAAHGGAS
ncbi:hypothetical protein [Amycolatopsis sp. CFH S0078]|uniref:hypothetical protein n=1 Tax=Amycolatopsis sp. CFH S0078 TaxID=1644108 RepID=UPI001431230F|nr:hypothetical protein [Amycolatopsis sp. CFH S0078]